MHRAVGLELEAGDAAERCYVVVLLARGSAEHVHLHVRRFLGKVPGGDVLPLEGVQGAQKTHRE